MRWFKEKIDDRIKAIVADVVAGHVNRSHLMSQILLISPQVTDIEMAVLWAGCACAIEEGRTKNGMEDETGKMLSNITQAFLDSYCQGYISNIYRSNLKLDPESRVILDSITPTVEAMSPERRMQTGDILGAVLANACELAGATISVYSAGFTEEEQQAAKKYALSLVENESNLKPYEKPQVTEWLANFSWA